jgi:hypothetical protein
MTDPWDPSSQPPAGYAPPGYGYPEYDGPPGRIRPTGKVLLLTIVTLGIYSYVYNYQVHDEMKRHSGRGLGGGIALLLSFLANVAMPFLTPSEVGNLYVRKGQRAPVNAWTGLWLLVPTVAGYVLLFGSLIATGVATESSSGSSDDAALGIAFAVSAIVYVVAVAAGGTVWLVKTNGALNEYWRALGVA